VPESPSDWREIAAANRARIVHLEHELGRVRERLHELTAEVAAVRFLGERVAELGDDVKELASQVGQVARRALERPSPVALGVLAQYLALAVAVVALAVAASR